MLHIVEECRKQREEINSKYAKALEIRRSVRLQARANGKPLSEAIILGREAYEAYLSSQCLSVPK